MSLAFQKAMCLRGGKGELDSCSMHVMKKREHGYSHSTCSDWSAHTLPCRAADDVRNARIKKTAEMKHESICNKGLGFSNRDCVLLYLQHTSATAAFMQVTELKAQGFVGEN